MSTASVKAPPFPQAKHYRVTPLAPVHMGVGETFNPMNYVVHNDVLFGFDEAQLLSVLGDQLQNLDRGDAAQQILGLQRQIFAERERLASHAEFTVPVTPHYSQLYNEKIGREAQREADGRNILNALQIEKTACESFSHQPFIPGSGIKGAIRTAILDGLNAGRQNVPSNVFGIHGDKEEEKRANRMLVRKGKELESQLLGYVKEGKVSVTEDPMKRLKISDARSSGKVLTDIRVTRSVPLRPKADGMPNAKGKGITTWLQVISPFQWQAFTLDVRLVPADDGRTPRTFEALAKCCNDYYWPLFTAEIQRNLENATFMQQGRQPEWVIELSRVLSGELGDALKAGKAFLLNVGKHGGALVKTLNGSRAIKIMKAPRRSFRPQPEEERLLAQQENQSQGLVPFGWVLVHEEGLSLPKSQQVCHALNAERAAQQVVLNERLEAGRAAALVELKRQEALRLAEQARRETEMRQKDAEAERLAGLSIAERLLEEFQSRIARGEDRQQGAGCNLARDLAQAIECWSNEPLDIKAKALDVALRVYEHLGVDIKNKKTRDRLNGLR